MLTPYFRDADTSQLNLTSRFAAKQNTLNGTGFVKASGTSITYDNSSYLTTSSAASTYLPLTGGTLTGDLYAKYLNTFAKTTYIPFDVGIGENLTNISSAFRGGTIMVFPDSNLIGSSANVFLANKLFAGEYSTFGSGMRNYAHQGGDTRNNSLAFYTSGIGSQNTNRLYINFNGDIGINDDTPSYKLDINGTLNATGAATLGSSLTVEGATVFGSSSAQYDFRVSSGTNVNMIFMDASENKVGIGTASPTKTLDVNGELNVNSAGTFGGRINTPWLERTYTNTTSSNFTVSVNTTWLDVNTNVLTTLTLPNASTYPGKELHIRQTGTGQIISFSSNVIPFTSPPTGSAGTAILNPTNNKAVTLVSDGTNWIIMQRSGN